MRRYKRIRIRDVWIDEHPGYLSTNISRPHNVRILPGIQDPGSDTLILTPSDPPRDSTTEPQARVCLLEPPTLSANLLRGIKATQWIRPIVNGGIVFPVARYTNGTANITGFNMVGYKPTAPVINTSNQVLQPLIYTFPIPYTVNRMKFHYTRDASVNALNMQTSLADKLQIGGITIRFFDSLSRHKGDIIHKALPDFIGDASIGPWDTCATASVVDLRTDQDLTDIVKIHIHFHSRHLGLVEIEAFGPSVPSDPVFPSLKAPTTWAYETLTAPQLRISTLPTAEYLSPTDLSFGVIPKPLNPNFGNAGTQLSWLTDNNSTTTVNYSNQASPFYWTLPTVRNVTEFEVYTRGTTVNTVTYDGPARCYVNFYDENKVLIYRTPEGIAGGPVGAGQYGKFFLKAGTEPFLVPNCKYIVVDTIDDGIDNWYNVYF